jgi:hypothetical protein
VPDQRRYHSGQASEDSGSASLGDTVRNVVGERSTPYPKPR